LRQNKEFAAEKATKWVRNIKNLANITVGAKKFKRRDSCIKNVLE
jgi:hypothetical protein